MKSKKKILFPGGLFVPAMVLYHELALHIWIMDGLHWGRLAAVTAFALGCGLTLGVISSLCSEKTGKGLSVGLSLLASVVWLVEFFVSDSYQVFMTPKTILSGAGGVAQDYFDLVMDLLKGDLWRIIMMLLPTILYGLFCRSVKAGWKTRGVLAAAAAGCCLLGVAMVRTQTGDWARFGQAYNFDSAVRCFGLNTALTLEMTHSGGDGGTPDFDVPEVTLPPEEPEGTEPAAVYEDNIMEALDFEALTASAPNKSVASVHSYVSSLTPSKQNEYTGLFEGKNLILITAEAFSAQVIDPERTPTLYRMANEGIRFEDYYQPAWGASTTSGEFSNVTGLVPTNGGLCMKEARQQDLFLNMGKQLQNLGYYSAAYHNHLKDFYDRDKTHTELGYDRFIALYGGLEGVDAVWPESDLQMMEATVPQYIDQQPFSIYYMTVSGHCVYSQKENVQSKNHYDEVADLPYSETVKCYLAAQMELEYAMESLLRQLEEAGIADDTVVVIATDHYPYGLERSRTWKNTDNYFAELYGLDSQYDVFQRDRNALIIWSGCLEDMDITVTEPVYSLDILPTLSNFFGVEYDSRLLVGRDVFSDTEPLVLWPDYSWKTDKGEYNAQTTVFTPAEGAQIPEGYVEYVSAMVANKLTYCNSVLELDYFNYLSEALGRK